MRLSTIGCGMGGDKWVAWHLRVSRGLTWVSVLLWKPFVTAWWQAFSDGVEMRSWPVEQPTEMDICLHAGAWLAR